MKEKEVFKSLKSLKPKKSHGYDGINSEILELGAEVLAVPLTYIINHSIVTGKYPSNWKLSKIVPLHKKGDKKILKNYRPVSLLSVPGMILERVVAMQIEEHFDKNNLLGNFQFGFRRNKNTTTELLTLFDTIMEAKEKKKEILVLLYDLSAAFDTVSHKILLEKLKLYGFDNNSMAWMETFLQNRKQSVEVCGKISKYQDMSTGTPQGSRLSPLLFVVLMADLNLWTEKSILSNFADDTQSIIVSDSRENLLETTLKEANSVIDFFASNNLVNNADKAAVLYNQKGKGSMIRVENIGGENIESSFTEKLLGLHINSDFEWSTHIDKISTELRQRIGLLRRIRNRIPKEKLVIIAEAIFNSKIRYGIAVYLHPVFEKEDLKMKKLSKNTALLQTLQNKMLRVIHGFKKLNYINMCQVREKIKMMSVNQMTVYHTLIESYNIVRNSASTQIQMKWSDNQGKKYSLRNITENDLKEPEKPIPKCTGFTYYGAKLYNMLPRNLRETENPATFKIKTKEWIWKNIPSH